MRLIDFLNEIEAAGELRRVGCEVSPCLEIAELTDRQCKREDGGDALLFEHTGTEFAVATNLMGSPSRLARALRVNHLGEIEARLDSLLGDLMSPKRTFMEKLSMLPRIKELSGFMPRHKRGRGECQRVEMEVDLDLLPILKSAPHDAERFFTLPLVHTIDPDTGSQNLGMYRMQVVDGQTTGMHWHRHKTGESHYQKYKARGERMPVVVCLGGDPVYTFCATAPLPEGIDEYILAGFLRSEAVRLVKTSVGIEVPEDVDFVLEGYVDPTEEKFYEGPFGDHTGFYSLEDYYPLFHITRITRSPRAVYPATIVGVPPMEDFYFAQASERIFLKPIQMVIAPEIRNLYMPMCGVAHNIACATISKSYPGQGVKVANALWGAGQMAFNKICMIFSHTGIELGDAQENLLFQLRETLSLFDAQRDMTLMQGTLDVLDHATATCGYGGKAILDLTVKLPEEGVRSKSPRPLQIGVGRLLEEYYTVVINDPRQVDTLVGTGVKFIVLVDTVVPLWGDLEVVAWIVAANCDPVRDIRLHEGVVVVDGRAKVDQLSRHPNVVCQSLDVIEMVDRRWAQYNLGDFVDSPSRKFLPLEYAGGATIDKNRNR
ncbi:MAG: UbiD family decarboxylase [Rikenellaceae bacterium]